MANRLSGEGVRGETFAFQFTPQPEHRLLHGLIGQSKGAPMHGCGPQTAGVLKNLHSLLRIHVNGLHDAAGLVCTNRDHREINGAVCLSQITKGGAVGAVTHMPEFAACPFDQPAAPVCLVAVERCSGGKVLSRG